MSAVTGAISDLIKERQLTHELAKQNEIMRRALRRIASAKGDAMIRLQQQALFALEAADGNIPDPENPEIMAGGWLHGSGGRAVEPAR